MIQTDQKKGQTIKEIRAREKQEAEKDLRAKCEKWAVEKIGDSELKSLSNRYKGLWYLPILDDDGNVELCLILQPINRHILSYASTKISEEGLYVFLESCLRECMVAGDIEIIDQDEYFIPAAMKFNDILQEKKAALVKR